MARLCFRGGGLRPMHIVQQGSEKLVPMQIDRAAIDSQACPTGENRAVACDRAMRHAQSECRRGLQRGDERPGRAGSPKPPRNLCADRCGLRVNRGGTGLFFSNPDQRRCGLRHPPATCPFPVRTAPRRARTASSPQRAACRRRRRACRPRWCGSRRVPTALMPLRTGWGSLRTWRRPHRRRLRTWRARNGKDQARLCVVAIDRNAPDLHAIRVGHGLADDGPYLFYFGQFGLHDEYIYDFKRRDWNYFNDD